MNFLTHMPKDGVQRLFIDAIERHDIHAVEAILKESCVETILKETLSLALINTVESGQLAMTNILVDFLLTDVTLIPKIAFAKIFACGAQQSSEDGIHQQILHRLLCEPLLFDAIVADIDYIFVQLLRYSQYNIIRWLITSPYAQHIHIREHNETLLLNAINKHAISILNLIMNNDDIPVKPDFSYANFACYVNAHELQAYDMIDYFLSLENEHRIDFESTTYNFHHQMSLIVAWDNNQTNQNINIMHKMMQSFYNGDMIGYMSNKTKYKECCRKLNIEPWEPPIGAPIDQIDLIME